jgi:midasin
LIKINYHKFLKNFLKVADRDKNQKFIESLNDLYHKKKFPLLVKCLSEAADQFLKKNPSPKFQAIRENLRNLEKQDISFYFLTGNLMKALKHGDWVLVDEINLASNDVLQKLLPAIEGKDVLFYERGDDSLVKVHPDFRLIGCMNPGGEIGKKELPYNIRCKFTTIFLQEMTSLCDVTEFVKGLLGVNENNHKIANAYLKLRNEISTHFSLRNLSRALHSLRKTKFTHRAVFDAMSLGFS